MPRKHRVLVCVVLSGLCLPSFCRAAEPTVAFSMSGDFLSFTLVQDGKPVEALVRGINDAGREIATGETEEGQGTFPLQGGSSFTIEFKIAGRSADPIRLQRSEDGNSVTPGKVLLSFGMRPCCLVFDRGGLTPNKVAVPSSAPTLPPWLFAFLGGSLLLLGGVVLVRSQGRSPLEPGPSRQS